MKCFVCRVHYCYSRAGEVIHALISHQGESLVHWDIFIQAFNRSLFCFFCHFSKMSSKEKCFIWFIWYLYQPETYSSMYRTSRWQDKKLKIGYMRNANRTWHKLNLTYTKQAVHIRATCDTTIWHKLYYVMLYEPFICVSCIFIPIFWRLSQHPCASVSMLPSGESSGWNHHTFPEHRSDAGMLQQF